MKTRLPRRFGVDPSTRYPSPVPGDRAPEGGQPHGSLLATGPIGRSLHVVLCGGGLQLALAVVAADDALSGAEGPLLRPQRAIARASMGDVRPVAAQSAPVAVRKCGMRAALSTREAVG